MISVNTHKLKNGLRLLHHYDDATQMVAVNLLYDVGSRDEQPGKTGLAHLMEHLMFTGSTNAPGFDAALQAAGGESNAWTNVDMTNFYETLPAHNVETAFWLESDRLLNLSLSHESITTQKSVVIEEFKQRCLNVPYGDLVHIVNRLAFTNHPYRWPTIGAKIEDIENVSSQEILDFFHRHYAVNNLILCVSGHIDFEQTVSLAQKWFGSIQPRALNPRRLPVEPRQQEPRFMQIGNAEVPQDLIYMIYHMCGRGDADYQACDQLSDILSNGTSSRFYRNILVKTGLFTELDASITGTYDPGLFLIRGRLAEGVGFDEAKAAVALELRHLLDHGVTEHELEKCSNKFQSSSLFETVGYAEKAVKLSKYELLNKAEDINFEIDKYRALTPERIGTVATKLFDERNCSTLYYGPNA